MKKIIIVAIAAMLCCVMLLPVSAEKYNGYEFPDKNNLTGAFEDVDLTEYKYEFIFKSQSDNIYYVYCKTEPLVGEDGVTLYANDSYFYKLINEEWNGFNHYYENETHTIKEFYWANKAIYYTNGNVYFTNPKCDGSTCPATDLNTDNICDECGAMFSVLRDYTPDDFPTGYPAVPSLEMPDAEYYLYKVKSSGSTYLLVYPSTVTPTYDTSEQNGLLYYSESYGNYRLDTTKNEWVLSSDDSPYIIGGTNNNSVEIYYSSDTIYDQNGDTFFPIPLWMEMDNLTQREMETVQPNLGGVMTTLVLCGVGCLALVIVLSLFGKRSLIFRK